MRVETRLLVALSNNSDCQLQNQPFDIDFLLRDDSLVNTIRYQMEYTNSEGTKRNLDLYIPKEVFLDAPIPDILVLRIAADL